ncbi:MAG: hypothetical protein JWQ47_1625 [Glaciihabitans sp.]|nr:hypothetical protein [Glaciihabitans sp.]
MVSATTARGIRCGLTHASTVVDMSCIRFNTPAQRRAMREAAPSMLTSEEAAALAATQHPAPPVTASKIARLRLLAADANPKIRESAASSYHAPEDVVIRLSKDPDAGVRGCVARNESTSCDILRSMADDESEVVRGWLAVNFFVPADVMERLADDSSETVRSLVRWKAELAGSELTEPELTEPERAESELASAH